MDPPFTSTRTRAEVQAEMREFMRQGMNPWADHYDQLHAFRGSLSRAQATADYLLWRREVAAMTGEDSGSTYLAARSFVLPAPAMASSAGRDE